MEAPTGTVFLHVTPDDAYLQWCFSGPDLRYNATIVRTTIRDLPILDRSIQTALRAWIRLRGSLSDDVQLEKEVITDFGAMQLRFSRFGSGVVPFPHERFAWDFVVGPGNYMAFRAFLIAALRQTEEVRALTQD